MFVVILWCEVDDVVCMVNDSNYGFVVYVWIYDLDWVIMMVNCIELGWV